MNFLNRARLEGPGRRSLPGRAPGWVVATVIGVLGGLLGGVLGGASARAEEAPAPAYTSPTDEPGRRVRVHYMWSNERRHDLFFKELAGLAGGYLGVGGDQNYTLAAAAKSQVLWLIDLDPAVTYMHRLYAALLVSAPTSKDFLGLFSGKQKDAVHTAVAGRYNDPVEQRAVLEIYHAYRDLLAKHLRATSKRSRGATWLTDAEKYQHLRELAISGRIVARIGDLTGPRTMLEIGEAARRAQTPVRVVYLSNAESWFRYGPEFRRNMSSMHFDDKSVVLRTVKSALLTYPSSDIWHYSVQKAQNFADNLGRPPYRSVDVAMLDAVARPKQKTGLSHIGFPDERGQKALFAAAGSATAKGKAKKITREARRSLIASGLVTRPPGNREKAREMDPERLRRAALELDASANR